MAVEQEIRAKSLEIAALILGKTDKSPEKQRMDLESGGDVIASGNPAGSILSPYRHLADLIAQDIEQAGQMEE
jgi:hypothetical protein